MLWEGRDCVRVNGDFVLSIGKISYEVTERKSSRFLRAGTYNFIKSDQKLAVCNSSQPRLV